MLDDPQRDPALDLALVPVRPTVIVDAGRVQPNGCTRCDGFGGTEWEPCPECLGADPDDDPCTGARGCRCGSCRFEEEPGGFGLGPNFGQSPDRAPTKHPDYPRSGCDEPGCGHPDPCDDCYAAACAAEEAGHGLPRDGHHEGDAPPVIGWSL